MVTETALITKIDKEYSYFLYYSDSVDNNNVIKFTALSF